MAKALWLGVLCVLRGHDDALHMDDDRLFLRCHSCGNETVGWDITAAPRWSPRLLRFRKRLAA